MKYNILIIYYHQYNILIIEFHICIWKICTSADCATYPFIKMAGLVGLKKISRKAMISPTCFELYLENYINLRIDLLIHQQEYF